MVDVAPCHHQTERYYPYIKQGARAKSKGGARLYIFDHVRFTTITELAASR